MRGKLSVSAALIVLAATVLAADAKVAVKPVWLAPVELTPRSDYSIGEQNVAVDQRDDVLAVWSGKSGVQARYRPAGGAWQAPVQLAACGVGATAAFDAAGDATIVWLQCTSTVSQMTTAVRHADGSWNSPLTLPTPGRSMWYPHLAVAASGAAVASWIETDGHVAVVQASVRAPGSNDWSRAAQVSSVAHTTTDLDGDAVAAIETSNGASVVIAILDGAAPKVTSPTFRQAGRVGQKLSFAARASDISAVSLRLYFGDRRYAAGASVTHVYRKAGRFAITLVATDAAGHAVTVTRTSVRISPRRS